MDKEWVNNKNNEAKAKRPELLTNLKNKLIESNLFDDTMIEYIISGLDNKMNENPQDYVNTMTVSMLLFDFEESHNIEVSGGQLMFIHDISSIIQELNVSNADYDRYLDSEPMHFHGDIIITDPCYIRNYDDDCSYNVKLEHMIYRDTLYGDWSCTTFDTNTKEAIGQFCADGGMVAVMALDDVLKHNPSFDYHTERPWTTTLIKDFDGEVYFKVKHSTYQYEGVMHDDFEVRVVGHGVNIKTNEPIDFETSQTGL